MAILRNTRQMHESFGPLAPSRMYSRGGDGPCVPRFVDAGEDDPLDVADDEVDRLLEAGWDPCHVALLTTGHRHPIQVERTDFHDQDGYWRTYWDVDVFYGHVLGCKGLERRAVVLCLNSSPGDSRPPGNEHARQPEPTQHSTCREESFSRHLQWALRIVTAGIDVPARRPAPCNRRT